jgi:hypothetical protein
MSALTLESDPSSMRDVSRCKKIVTLFFEIFSLDFNCLHH